ncbi:MAG: polyprenyl synthetase family protein [Bacillota bacterium]|nr:polyprenyl synthetase family protein [Bacillota bacterium]
MATGFLPAVEQRLRKHLSYPVSAVQNIMDHVLAGRGKRLRPLLCISAAACSGPPSPAALDVACAVEMVHTASLIHDDIIDRANVRRRMPSVNNLWGNHTAVLAGDLILARALEILIPHAATGVLNVVSQAVVDMCSSEIEQGEARFDTSVSEQRYLARIGGKTASLLKAACAGGALVSGASGALLERLGQFGYCLGLAFQISDDILDFVGDPDDLGKPVCSDLRQGIMTLPPIYLLAHPDRGPYLRESIEKRLVSRRLARIRRDLEATGSLAGAVDKATFFASEARKCVSSIPAQEARAPFLAVVSMLEQRLEGRLSDRQMLAAVGGGSEPATLPETATEETH